MDLREQLQHALPRFLRRCDASSTRLAYKRELRRFLDWLPESVDDELLYDYRDYLRARGLGPTTIRWPRSMNVLNALKRPTWAIGPTGPMRRAHGNPGRRVGSKRNVPETADG